MPGVVLFRRLCAPLVVALVLLAPVGATATAASPADPSGSVSAVNGFSLSRLPSDAWDAQLNAMSANGIQMVRSDADWGTIEPQSPQSPDFAWQFDSTDQWVAALARHHLTWQPILDYNNSWATAAGDPSDFAAFGRAVIARYGAGGSFWAENPELPAEPVRIVEVWNEENGQPWFISPADYAPLYAATRAAIHQVTDQVSVDVGGLSDDSGDFTPALDYPAWYVLNMFAADPGLAGHVDGFALHPYGTTATDSAQWLAEFRMVLRQLGEGATPIDVTELGWMAGATTADEQWRAAQMNALGLALGNSDCGLRELAPYDWVNPTAVSDPGDFGFVDPGAQDTTLRPAASAWFTALRQATQSPTSALCASAPSAQAAASDLHAVPPSAASVPADPAPVPAASSPQSGAPAGRPAATLGPLGPAPATHVTSRGGRNAPRATAAAVRRGRTAARRARPSVKSRAHHARSRDAHRLRAGHRMRKSARRLRRHR